MKRSRFIAVARPHFDNRARAADGRNVMALRAGSPIKKRPQTFCCVFDFEEIGAAEPEQFQLAGGETWERGARRRFLLAPKHGGCEQRGAG
jgi:hypothetical protein